MTTLQRKVDKYAENVLNEIHSFIESKANTSIAIIGIKTHYYLQNPPDDRISFNDWFDDLKLDAMFKQKVKGLSVQVMIETDLGPTKLIINN